ncbi:hypothetical protein PVAND_004045 [Polypedilum vanderplanki]|uniref:Uncharacterized protein n=1 Tax=Polypedilum vanderplanki TaxID=319348 RepID=A0A9J6BWI7_POLVA|nr:hypothetical protein PVAND_004045 [Polypedilum vanderplanki]
MRRQKKFSILFFSKVSFTLLLVLFIFCFKNAYSSSQFDLSQASNSIQLNFMYKVIKRVSDAIPINIIHISNITNWDHKLFKSAAIFVKSLKNLQFLHENSKTKNYQVPLIEYSGFDKLKFLVYLEYFEKLKDLNSFYTDNDIGMIGSYGELSFFEFFIVNDDKIIVLYLNHLFYENFCGKPSFKVINAMTFKAQKWKKKMRNFDIYEHFNGCMLSFWIELGFDFYFIDSNIQNAHDVRDIYLVKMR